ncbi:copper-translocating P-type ATPase [Metabacillus idriensis]|uniref:heavy metal translocating P-type ATPase n=1 Tax=Metabacillus idriensis TaxID=324768 RepID=UPI0009F5DD4B|nr:heavy metal translocating P-type ATPase [Metabacillus idriensis]MCM3598140.1 copper-translocating P-type ATPase [Metabacillus idriensis]
MPEHREHNQNSNNHISNNKEHTPHNHRDHDSVHENHDNHKSSNHDSKYEDHSSHHDHSHHNHVMDGEVEKGNSHKHQHDNGSHEHGDGHGRHGNHHGHMVEDFKKRFYISLIISLPVFFLSHMIQSLLGFEFTFPYDSIVLFLLSSFVFFYGGYPFLKGAIDELRQKNPGMMTLIALAIVVAYVYSTLTVFGLEGMDYYWELVTLIDIMLLGHWLEMKSVMGASNALEQLVKLMPSEAHKITDEGTKDVPVSDLSPGDKVLVKPGERVPVDGIIKKGRSTIDESMLTGESVPVEKSQDHEVTGGSVNGDGALTIEVKNTGEESYLSQVVKMVQEAQESKSRTQDLSNRAAKWLFYIALGAGILTLVGWLIVGFSFNYALERMVTVMIIACPHALGLAVPLVIATSTAISAKKGLLIRNRTQFEEARRINAVVFDKTGTLTKGEFGITDLIVADGYTDNTVLKMVASLEGQSEHPIARGVLNSVKEKEMKIPDPEEFEYMQGKGLRGRVDGKEVFAVSPGYMKEQNLPYPEEKYKELSMEGKTVIFAIIDGEFAGMIALADQIRESAKKAIQDLKEMNIESIMLTGDNQQVANYVGKQIGLDEVYAEVLPHEKAKKINEIKQGNKKVAMTGDGVNDAPALANADLGIAIGAGTDVAIETADVILVNSNPQDVVEIIELSRKTYRKMIQNLWWGAGYNIIAIPLASGILYQSGFVLSPAVGAILMSLSTIIVAINAKLLRA